MLRFNQAVFELEAVEKRLFSTLRGYRAVTIIFVTGQNYSYIHH